MPIFKAPLLGGSHIPEDINYKGWSGDPAWIQGALIMGAGGTLNVVRVKLRAGVATNVILHFTVAGGTLTAGQNFAGLYNGAGALLGAGAVTADQTANWQSGGLKVMPLTVAQLVSAGFYYVAWYAVGVTLPTISRMISSNTAITNAGLSAPNLRFATADTGLTTALPGSIGTQTGTNHAYWAAVS